jgi:ketosteroid isomerase-like protein
VDQGRAQNEDLLRGIYEAANRGDFDAMLEPFHDDVAWETPTHWIRGRSKLVRWLVGWQASYSPHHELEDVIHVDQDVVVALVHISYQGRPDNDPAHVWTIRDGRVAQVRVYPVRQQALQALGIEDR